MYRMFTSECFFDKPLSKFIAMIWAPHCLNCTGSAETTTVDSLRLAIKLASYPVITDIIHSILAWRVDAMRQRKEVPNCRTQDGKSWEECPANTYNPEKDPYQRCSQRSTRYRRDVKSMFNVTAKRVQDATNLLNDLVGSYDQFMTAVTNASKLPGSNVFSSKELKDFYSVLKGFDVDCLRAPRERSINLAGGGRATKVDKKYQDSALKLYDKPTLLKMCKELPSCKKKLSLVWSTSADDLRKNIAKAIDRVTPTNPFGKCSSKSECQEAVKNAKWMEDYNGHMSEGDLKNGIIESRYCGCDHMSFTECMNRIGGGFKTCVKQCPIQTGVCGCRPGFCFHVHEKYGPTCRPDHTTPGLVGLNGMRDNLLEWVLVRKYEIGSVSKVLAQIAGLGSGAAIQEHNHSADED
jgi:hypothetical protein